jgi:hypothetical protein
VDGKFGYWDELEERREGSGEREENEMMRG